MIKLPSWKIFATLAVCVLGVYFALPNLFSPAYVEKSSWLPQKRVNLGLDLQGGSHILLEVDYATALRDKYALLASTLRTELRKEHLGYVGLHASDQAITFKLRDADAATVAKAKAIAQDLDRDVVVTTDAGAEATAKAGGTFHLAYSPTALDRIKKQIVEQSIEIIHRRIDENGTKEPLVQQQGDNLIVLQLPGVGDPSYVKSMLGTTAKLAFRMVCDATDRGTPTGCTPVTLAPDERYEGQSPTMFVQKNALVTGDMLVDAQPTMDDRNRPAVAFKFDAVGGKLFGAATRDNVGRPFAIVLDNVIISAPVIQSPIMGGNGIITGNFTVAETQKLSLLLRAGALPAPLTILEERSVGPELGADSIQAGERATVYAIVLVGVFMLVAYALFGVIANIAVVFNIIFLMAGLTLMGATLTLPGIAGIALTIGMAVDANVLIYERIKEELRKNRPYPAALDAGYKRAMATILDSNITTLLGALFLYQFGTGPIRGFAVTLALGIIISMFTAITLTRVIAVLWLRWRQPKVLSI